MKRRYKMALLTRDQLTNANLDFIHLAEIILGVTASGAAITSSTDRLGNSKKTLAALLQLFARENPIGTYAAGQLIERSTQTVNFDAGSGVQLWSWAGALPHNTTGLPDDRPGTNPNWLSVIPANLGSAALSANSDFLSSSGDTGSGPYIFTGSVIVPNPTASNHAANRDYVQSLSLPTGSLVMWPTSTIPATGFLQARGQTFSATTYPELALIYTNLTLPDMRGEFIRGWDDGRGVDNGRGILTSQADEFAAHTHPLTSSNAIFNVREGTGTQQQVPNDVTSVTGSRGGTETRPRNIAWMMMIVAR